MKIRQILTALGVFSVLSLSQGALAEQVARPYDKTFLTEVEDATCVRLR